MKFSEYLSTHHAFTTSDLMASMDSPTAAEKQLRLAIRAGKVRRARRGLLVSNYGPFEGAVIDPPELIAALDKDAVASYHSALELYGVAHNVSFVYQFRSDAIKSRFAFGVVRYLPAGRVGDTKWKLKRTNTTYVRLTTREQTIVDCLDKPSRAGGVEEVVRSLTALFYVDVEELITLVGQRTPATASRVGWLLEQKADDWMVSKDQLAPVESMLGSGPYRLGRPGPEGTCWSKRWRLLLPAHSEEVDAWVFRM